MEVQLSLLAVSIKKLPLLGEEMFQEFLGENSKLKMEDTDLHQFERHWRKSTVKTHLFLSF